MLNLFFITTINQGTIIYVLTLGDNYCNLFAWLWNTLSVEIHKNIHRYSRAPYQTIGVDLKLKFCQGAQVSAILYPWLRDDHSASCKSHALLSLSFFSLVNYLVNSNFSLWRKFIHYSIVLQLNYIILSYRVERYTLKKLLQYYIYVHV